MSALFNPAKDMVRGEKLEYETAMHPLSQLSSYVIGFLMILAGYYAMTGASYILVLDVVAIYLAYSLSLKSVGSLVRSGVSVFLGLYGLSVLTNLLSNLSAQLRNAQELLAALAAGQTDRLLSSLTPILDPSTTISGAIGLLDSTLQEAFSYAAPYMPALSTTMMVAGAYVIVSSYFYTRGQRVYFTNRRVVITKKFGGASMFQATIDAVSDMSSNRGLGGRIFGYGAMYLTTTSGSGLKERDEDRKPKPGRAVQGVKLTVDGVKKPEDAVNAFVRLRIEFIDALHLKEIKDYVKRTAGALERPEEQRITLTTQGASLPLANRSSLPLDKSCRVCGENFNAGEETLLCSRCKAAFHSSCLEVSPQRKGSCPLCGGAMVVP